MNSILIKNVLLNDETTDIFIEGNKIKSIGKDLIFPADKIIEGTRKAVIPGFINGHTHAAMTIFRGFGDDMPLMPWLEEKIWPNEAKLTPDDIYWGTKLACLEMIKSGTTTFADMYFMVDRSADAVEEMGLRGILGATCFDQFQPELTEVYIRRSEDTYKTLEKYGDRVQYAIAPHAIYTVSGELIKWCDKFSEEHHVPVHIHLAETEIEVENSIKNFGTTPVRYLNKLGVLSPRMVVAHGVYMDDEELQILADHGVKVVHNPASNMKLASGVKFKYEEMRKLGILVGLGTDGCSSSNNLDMIEAMKLASLLGKGWRKDPEAVKAQDIFKTATADGAAIFGLNAGKIKEGCLADLSLIDIHRPAFTPNYSTVSNLVYAANGSCVDTVICNGKVIMENKFIPGEDEILEKVNQIAYRLLKS